MLSRGTLAALGNWVQRTVRDRRVALTPSRQPRLVGWSQGDLLLGPIDWEPQTGRDKEKGATAFLCCYYMHPLSRCFTRWSVLTFLTLHAAHGHAHLTPHCAVPTGMPQSLKKMTFYREKTRKMCGLCIRHSNFIFTDSIVYILGSLL